MAPERGRETDQDFDAVAEDFEGDVYGSSKGQVRLGVLREDDLWDIREYRIAPVLTR